MTKQTKHQETPLPLPELPDFSEKKMPVINQSKITVEEWSRDVPREIIDTIHYMSDELRRESPMLMPTVETYLKRRGGRE